MNDAHASTAPLVPLLTVLLAASPTIGSSNPPKTARPSAVGDHAAWESLGEAIVARESTRTGRDFVDYTERDYASLMGRLDLARDEDRWTWSHVTGIPILALRESALFFRSNAHLLADLARAGAMTPDELKALRTEYDAETDGAIVRDAQGRPLPLRAIGIPALRFLTQTGQILHNRDFAEDRTRVAVLGPYLADFGELDHGEQVLDAVRALPLSIVKLLRGKALYLSTARGEGFEAIWYPVGSDRFPRFAGMQPGVFVGGRAGFEVPDALIRGVGRIVLETVLQGDYFGIYAHPLQFLELQALTAERRRIFGRRRDGPAPAEHGSISEAGRRSPTDGFVEHFHAYLTDRERFRAQATRERLLGRRELQDKLEFMERLVERTPPTMRRLSGELMGRVDVERQRAILREYLTQAVQQPARVARFQAEFGKSSEQITEEEYAAFLGTLDLDRDEDLWSWSAVTGIPVVALSHRSNFFHMNAHLLADASAAKRMSWAELTGLRTHFDRLTRRLRIVDGNGEELPLRDLPPDLVQATETTAGVSHNAGFADDRIVYEALEPWLLRLADLENRRELSEGIRMLPLSVVRAYRGKALYPTDRSRTGWAVTWRVGNDENPSYVGLQPGSFVEPRRDPRRSAAVGGDLVRGDRGSLGGSSADSLLHEVGHVLDHAVIGGRSDAAAFPHQFPALRALLDEKNRVFGKGDGEVPQTDHGYISRYARTNAQESFAEHFWAYVRDREAFRSRALAEQQAGHPELEQKFRFMEKLVEQTPPKMQPLSAEFLRSMPQGQPADDGRQQAVVTEYRRRRAEKETVVAAVERRFGRTFSAFGEEDYARLMQELDLAGDDGLWTWSHLTGITILGLSEQSTLFYMNAHLLEDVAAAAAMPLEQLVELDTGYDPETNRPTLHSVAGESLRLRDIPEDTIRRSVRTESLTHDENFAEPRTLLEVVAPFLVPLDEIPHREAIAEGLRSLPLSVVQAYRGKAIYLTTRPGRSYAVGMPVSNATYSGFAGMQTGVFVDRTGEARTAHALVHELGHVIDYAAISGRYGSYLHAYQVPRFQALRERKERVFGSQDDAVPQTEHGYVSGYARVNAQESFAEHFATYILDRERFREMAREQDAAGHPELMDKYRFLETLLEQPRVTAQPLTRHGVAALERSEPPR